MSIDIAAANAELEGKEPIEMVRWAVSVADGGAMVSTNFRPHEAVILHLCAQAQPDMRVLWVDSGYNTQATYRHAEELIQRLNLNITAFIPEMTAARRDTLMGGIPSLDDEETHAEFTRQVKLEPFRRGLAAMNPTVWLTALRRDQTEFRANMDVVSQDPGGPVKVCPVLDWTEADMDAYLAKHDLPNELDYFDPTKVLSDRECGLHPAFFEEQKQ